MLRGYQHIVNFDFLHARNETRPYACTFDTELESAAPGWLRPKELPEDYGFNAIKLDGRVNLSSKKFSLLIRGDHLRYGFVGVTTDDESCYSLVNATTFTVPEGKELKHLYLVVMGAPEKHAPTHRQFPYEIQIHDE